jgi:uncharacterized protein with HEPN domain
MLFVSSRTWQARAQDILNAIQAITVQTAGMSFEDFAQQDMVVKAVLYDFIVIGEASANIPTEIQQRYPELPWRSMKDMRNVAAHEYFQVDLPTIWRTIQQSLPPLVEPLQQLLNVESQ